MSLGHGLRVLVIEDNPDGAASLQMLLSFVGHEVRVAPSGPEGLRTAKQWPPDVVLCDIGLPGMDGCQVAEELRKDGSTAQARLIAVTAYGDQATRHRAQASGFKHVLTKPADPARLLRLLGPTVEGGGVFGR